MTDVSIALAVAAGALSFVSPCVLALLPVYLAFLGTAAVEDDGSEAATAPIAILPQALLFVAGFSVLFILLGTALGVLGAILTMGASTGSAPAVAALLAAYSVGLALPFLAAAAAFPHLRPLVGWLRRHHRGVQIASGLLIVVIGILIYFNAFARLASLFTFVL